MKSATEIEHALRTHRLPGLDELLPDEFILPHYDGYSITNPGSAWVGGNPDADNNILFFSPLRMLHL